MAPNTADPTQDNSGVRAADEATPLLQAPDSGGLTTTSTIGQDQDAQTANGQLNGHAKPTNNQSTSAAQDASQEDDEDEDDRPMPVTQILFLCYAALAEPVAYFSIFPFVNEMIHTTGHVPEKNVGFWAGTIESLFSVVQMILMIFYGRAADRLGRKPVLVFSLAGVGISTALFGMGQSLGQMICLRCLAGAFGGSVVTIRTMISENCSKSTQARAFSWYMFIRNFGIFLGPLIGGPLANPTQQFPSVFNGIAFWEHYPYALPTYVAGAVVLSSAVTTLLFVNETLKRKIDGSAKPEATMPTLTVLKSPGVPMVLYIQAHTMVLALMYTAVIPVFMYTSVPNGGFGFSDQWIAIFLAVSGGSQALWMLLAFPALHKRFGTGKVMRWCSAGWPIFIFGYPIFNEFLRRKWFTAFWVIAPIQLVGGSAIAMGFTCVQLAINAVSPSSTGFATLNALALSVTSGVRAFAPALGTSLFAAGVRSGWVHGHAVFFFVLFPLGVGLVVACNFLPANADGGGKKEAAQETSTEE